MQNGTLVEFWSGGSGYTGFVIGTCSYDNCGEPNAYVVRYVCREGDDIPRKPYTIAAMNRVEPVKDFPQNFLVGAHWSATPEDRCEKWELIRDQMTGNLLVVPMKKESPA